MVSPSKMSAFLPFLSAVLLALIVLRAGPTSPSPDGEAAGEEYFMKGPSPDGVGAGAAVPVEGPLNRLPKLQQGDISTIQSVQKVALVY